MFKHVWLAGCLILGSAPALAEHPHHASSELQVAHAWARAMPSTAKTAAVYLHVHNQSAVDDRLESASTPVAGRVELHTVERQNDVMKMVHINNLPVAANAHVELAPGGLHLMLFELKTPLNAGSEFPLTLTFAKAGTREVTVSVSEKSPQATGHQHQH